MTELQYKKITIIGAGALGSHVAQFLRNEGKLRVVDFDRVEQKNTLSQFCARASVGRNKAEALAQLFQFAWGQTIDTKTVKFTDDNARTLLQGQSLVLDCTDNVEARKCIQYWAKELTLPTLHGAVAADGSFGQVVWTENFQADEGEAGAATCEGGEHLPFLVQTAGVLAAAAQAYLKDGERRQYSVWPRGTKML